MIEVEEFFLPYQKKWIVDESRIKVMEKSRQIGMTWTTAYSLVRGHTLNSCKQDSWVSSRDELQAKLFIEDCKKFCKVLNLAVEEISGSSFLGERNTSGVSLEFVNGTKINSLSSNADAQAGKRGTRVLDEFALHPDPMKLYSIAYPGITWGGRLEIISTHRGSENFFNKLIGEIVHNGNPKNISYHRVTLEDALDQGFLRKLKSSLGKDSEIQGMDESEYFDFIKRSCADEESFMQEYMCSPASDVSTFISYDMMSNCFYDIEEEWENRFISRKNELYLGVDIARSKDFTVFWLLEKAGDVLYTRDVKALRGISFSEQESILHSYLRMGNLRRVSIDQTGIGRQFAERAGDRYGSTRVEGINFTQQSKEILAYLLREKFEDVKVRIPDIEEIRCDIRSIRKEITPLGGIRFSADSSENGHADRFWALALAIYSAKESSFNSGLQLIEKAEKKFIW